MHQMKKKALLWIFAGALFSLLVVLVVFCGLSGTVFVTDPEGIPETANAVMNCLHTGDWNTMESLIAGNPLLDPKAGEAHSAQKVLWEAYQQSLNWSCASEYEIQGSYVMLPVHISCLDIRRTANSMANILKDMPDHENSEKKDILLAEAARQVLEKDNILMQRDITLTLLREHGQWHVVPDKAFLKLLSGFMAA